MAHILVPSFEEVYKCYRPLWTLLYEAADQAMPEAAEKFRSGKHTFEGGVHAGDVRLLLRDYLDAHSTNRDIEASEEEEFEREHVNNCGLSIRYRDAYVKVYKSDNGQMPPARTKAQKCHYQQPRGLQPTLWSLMLRDEAVRDIDRLACGPIHLVAHWHVADPPSLRLRNFLLAFPNGAANPPHWNKPLPNPISFLAGIGADTYTDEPNLDDNIKGLRRLPPDPTGDRSDE